MISKVGKRRAVGAAARVSRLLTATGLVVVAAAQARAQALYTASRAGELQVGGYFALGESHYLPIDVQGAAAPLSDLSRTVHLRGGGVYGSFDMVHHAGVALDFRHLGATDDTSAQTTVEVAGRYTPFRGRWIVPFLQAGIGHGWYRYPEGVATVGHNLYGLGGGLDYHLSTALNLRAAFEYQSWLGVPLKNPQPEAVTLGVAYRFH